MRIWILLICILAAASTWCGITRHHQRGHPPPASLKIKLAARSVVAGIIVYFCLLLLAVLYMAARA